MTDPGLPVDPGLLGRFREAGQRIAWRPAPKLPRRPRGRTARVAHLHDEEARVEAWGNEREGGMAVDSGPVGALVLLLEIDRRGPPTLLGAAEATRDAAFPGGSIVAAWGDEAVPRDSAPRLQDLVELARYALR
ncbi:MAG TPA: hypothetical protein VEH57_06075 [Thermoplasmata archaeon]|jgi:hypothetical protein|nr:hypothetical protein [Thermoplasmata archaeon]